MKSLNLYELTPDLNNKGEEMQRESENKYYHDKNMRLDKRLSKQSKRRWFKSPYRSFWRHCNENCVLFPTPL